MGGPIIGYPFGRSLYSSSSSVQSYSGSHCSLLPVAAGAPAPTPGQGGFSPEQGGAAALPCLTDVFEAAKAFWPTLSFNSSSGSSNSSSISHNGLISSLRLGVLAILPADSYKEYYQSEDTYQSTHEKKAPKASKSKPGCSHIAIIRGAT
ncbi:hypothetical protein ACP70R_044008 [Stipagrostis hirtigluma subsp. patula]